MKGVLGETEAVQWVKGLYLASAEKVAQIVKKEGGEAKEMMVIGHNPGLHMLACALALPKHTHQRMMLEMKYPTGALTVLRFAVNDWHDIAPGTGELLDFMTPKELQ